MRTDAENAVARCDARLLRRSALRDAAHLDPSGPVGNRHDAVVRAGGEHVRDRRHRDRQANQANRVEPAAQRASPLGHVVSRRRQAHGLHRCGYVLKRGMLIGDVWTLRYSSPAMPFITFEGIEGSGKSTQLRLAGERLRALGKQVLETRVPGGTAVGQTLRNILMDAANTRLDPVTEWLLLEADRRQHVRETLQPALARGDFVHSHRHADAQRHYPASPPRRYVSYPARF